MKEYPYSLDILFPNGVVTDNAVLDQITGNAGLTVSWQANTDLNGLAVYLHGRYYIGIALEVWEDELRAILWDENSLSNGEPLIVTLAQDFPALLKRLEKEDG